MNLIEDLPTLMSSDEIDGFSTFANLIDVGAAPARWWARPG